MKATIAIGVAMLLLACSISSPDKNGERVAPEQGSSASQAQLADNFVLIGRNALFNRGMNAALAIFDHFLYVGNRSDGSNSCGVFGGQPVLTPGPDGTCPHVHPGILILDIGVPSSPSVVGEIPAEVAAPNAEGNPEGVTSRELRVWPAKKLLIELSFSCSAKIHACPLAPADVPRDVAFPFEYKFFDLSDPVHPQLIARHVTKSSAGLAIKPHEFFLWIDPKNANRAMLYESTPSASASPTRPNFVVEDISDVPNGGDVKLVAEANWNQFFPNSSNPANYDFDLALHSMTPTADGRTTYLAYLRGGMLVLDTSDVANGASPGSVISLNDKLLTPVANRPIWGAGNQCTGGTSLGCSESHSAVPVPSRPFEVNIDEVYGTFTAPSFGWPWGWMRIIDVRDASRPLIVSEFKILQNTEAFQSQVDPLTQQFTSYSTHNLTVLPRLVVDSWHSGGLRAVDISDPLNPQAAGVFSPAPLDSVALEDPALSQGPNKVVMWSFPIIRNGLIYVVDVRNGLFVLQFDGPQHDDVDQIGFLEGNSNLGDALTLAGVR